jgi:hypothetical protein
MFGKIFLRHDQTWSELHKKSQNPCITIYSPDWLENAIKQISSHFSNCKFEIYDGNRNKTDQIFSIGDELNLHQLVTIARNEPVNVTGKIKFEYYENIVKDR